MKRAFTLLIIMIFAAGLLITCKKDKGNPPVLPPSESMTIDFSNFSTGTKSAADAPKGVNEINWDFSVLTASYWRAVISTTLAIPVAAFKIAVNQTPTYLSDKTWQWSYSVSVLSVSYSVRLTGQNRTSDVLWNMYISKTGAGGFTDFLWFTGTSKTDGKSGQWILNYSPTYNEPLLQIDWTGTGTAVTYIKYTYVRALTSDSPRVADTFKDSYIEYGAQSGTYNYYYKLHFYYLSEFYDADVNWSSTGIIGRVKCLKFFGDSLWHCWDASHVDTVCP